MSASEKLKALDTRMPVPFRDLTDRRNDYFAALANLSLALPQIVAVTNAAEVLSGQTFGALDSRAFYALREALAALDEALS